jgi:hypothetical protein
MGFKTHTEQMTVNGVGGDFNAYIFPEREGEVVQKPPSGIVMTPQLMSEIHKGLEAMRKPSLKRRRVIFLKATKLAPSNPDAAYLLGTAELGLQGAMPIG